MKNYNSAPLPFQGQKRMWVKELRSLLKSFPSDGTYVDLFGGSGLLSHTVKQMHPEARVIFNDYDHYMSRLEHIGDTNALIARMREIVQGVAPKERLSEERKRAILALVKSEEQRTGFVDYITLSSCVLFSGKYANDYNELSSNGFYNRVVLSDYSCDGYLDGVEAVRYDYKELFARCKDIPKVVFIVDPPYLSTDCKSYKNVNYWKIKDYLDVLKVLEDTRFVFFTSEKSQLIELAEWMAEHPMTTSPFERTQRLEVSSRVNHNAKYKDIMLYTAA